MLQVLKQRLKGNKTFFFVVIAILINLSVSVIKIHDQFFCKKVKMINLELLHVTFFKKKNSENFCKLLLIQISAMIHGSALLPKALWLAPLHCSFCKLFTIQDSLITRFSSWEYCLPDMQHAAHPCMGDEGLTLLEKRKEEQKAVQPGMFCKQCCNLLTHLLG